MTCIKLVLHFSTWRTETKFRAFSKTAQCSAPTFTPTPVFSELPNGIIYSNVEWQCQYIYLSLAILNRKYIKYIYTWYWLHSSFKTLIKAASFMGKQNSMKIYIQNNPPNRTGGFLEAIWPDVYYEPNSRICNYTENIESTLHFKTRKPHTVNMRLEFVTIIKMRCWTMT